MHEYGLMQDVVNLALAACPSPVAGDGLCVRIEVGEFAVADRESLETAYEILTRGTPLQGSSLEMSEVAGRAICQACEFEGSAADLGDELSEPPALLLCPRCGFPLLVTAGAGITLLGVQLQDRGRPTESVPGRGGR